MTTPTLHGAPHNGENTPDPSTISAQDPAWQAHVKTRQMKHEVGISHIGSEAEAMFLILWRPVGVTLRLGVTLSGAGIFGVRADRPRRLAASQRIAEIMQDHPSCTNVLRYDTIRGSVTLGAELAAAVRLTGGRCAVVEVGDWPSCDELQRFSTQCPDVRIAIRVSVGESEFSNLDRLAERVACYHDTFPDAELVLDSNRSLMTTMAAERIRAAHPRLRTVVTGAAAAPTEALLALFAGLPGVVVVAEGIVRDASDALDREAARVYLQEANRLFLASISQKEGP